MDSEIIPRRWKLEAKNRKLKTEYGVEQTNPISEREKTKSLLNSCLLEPEG